MVLLFVIVFLSWLIVLYFAEKYLKTLAPTDNTAQLLMSLAPIYSFHSNAYPSHFCTEFFRYFFHFLSFFSMSRKRTYPEDELRQLASISDFSESEYTESTSEESSEEESDDEVVPPNHNDLFDEEERQSQTPPSFSWSDVSNFTPRMPLITYIKGKVNLSIGDEATELDFFFKIFPKSLFIYIAQCTNERIEMVNEALREKEASLSSGSQKAKDKTHHLTDQFEIMTVVGVMLITSYNRVPQMAHYWSVNSSLGNAAIQKAMSRDRFLFLISKLYFNSPKKPAHASKLYYIEQVVSCLKYTFLKSFTDSTRQSVDESMIKFKGRSSLKQYQPLKPVKRGIKVWERCDSKTGYVYDFNIYAGKELSVTEGTLGERVVKKLVSTVKIPQIILCFDRFFTSVNLMYTLPHGCVGTYMKGRKNTPAFPTARRGEMQRGDSIFQVTTEGIIAVKWMDTKEVFIMSNCHSNELITTIRTLKDGSKKEFPCPSMVTFYNEFMGGVDLSDQLGTCYEVNRKSNKWWKKVFYRLLMTSIVNAHVVHQDVNDRKRPLLPFLVAVAESLLKFGSASKEVNKQRHCSSESTSSSSRSSNKSARLLNVGEHLPIEGNTRRRCAWCAKNKKEARSKMLCSSCNVALCKKCFKPYHTLKKLRL